MRPAVYGLLLENKQVLLRRHAETRLWYPPGGIVAPGRDPVRIVRAYFRAATGVEPVLRQLVHIEQLHRTDDDQSWQLICMYYALARPIGAAAPLLGSAAALEPPEWVPLSLLSPQDMQFGYDAVRLAEALVVDAHTG